VLNGALSRGARIIGSAPWLPLFGASAVAAVLLFVSSLTTQTDVAAVTTLLGLAACGAAAGYALDEEAGAVADATPTSRGHRIAWRLLVLSLPAGVAITGLVALDRVDASTHWVRLAPLAAGALAFGVALAAAMRRVGSTAPGDLAGVLALCVVVLVVMVDPARRWATMAPLGDSMHLGRTVLLWSVVVIACAAITLSCSQDPARSGSLTHRHRRRGRRKAQHPGRETR
jgi:hypothetical protein